MFAIKGAEAKEDQMWGKKGCLKLMSFVRSPVQASHIACKPPLVRSGPRLTKLIKGRFKIFKESKHKDPSLNTQSHHMRTCALRVLSKIFMSNPSGLCLITCEHVHNAVHNLLCQSILLVHWVVHGSWSHCHPGRHRRHWTGLNLARSCHPWSSAYCHRQLWTRRRIDAARNRTCGKLMSLIR